ncbi:FUN14 domain-containing protein 1-like isoform X2 [Xenia sp. Carnegie-2017]|uniref:FUN14 domain-containing protein 1-like isoform X2 n=1 Tax=Xenia sp. Carnegie-2017 TaxID=2897299 RepID=UPI001F03F83D|nr:FUN14 domain-containing protein 1-like isoform X2 [Xenia sp. Carnegie-2017]
MSSEEYEKNENEQEEEDSVDGFEVIERLRGRDRTYWDIASQQFAHLDLSRRPVYQQLGVGGISGWLVGSIFKKIGKLTALAVGSGLLVLQITSQSGYVTINWKKINKDVGKVSRSMSKKVEEYTSFRSSENRAKNFLLKGGQVVQKNIVVASGFAGGFLLGLAT